MEKNIPEIKVKKLPLPVYYKENLRRFLKESSLNGLKYIENVRNSIWERGYYLISFSIAFNAGLYMALYFFQRWQSTPVIIGISPRATSIQDIPFPTVTFCNMNQALASKVKDIQPGTPEYAMLQKVCFQTYNYTRFQNFKPRSKDDSVLEFKIKYAQSCKDMMVYCKYGPNEEPCTNLFSDIILDEGLCCIFNRLHPLFLAKGETPFIKDYTSLNGRTNIPVNWNLETGYKEPLPKSFYPRQAAGSGVSMGLTVVLYADIDEYYCSSTNGDGFKTLLYNPIDLPNVRHTGLPIMIGHQTRFRIKTKLMQSQPSLRYTSPKKRQCYFSDEKKLLYFKHYTRRFCELECNCLQMWRLCKCIPYHMPKVIRNATTCFLNDFDCVVKTEYLPLEPELLKCKAECLPGCHNLQYFPDMFVSPMARGDFRMQEPFFRNVSVEEMNKNFAMVRIYYLDNYVRGYTKVPYMGFTELLSQTGGIMSLMVGFSVISISEVIFFILLKPFFDIIMRRNPAIFESGDQVKEKKIENNQTHTQLLFRRRKNIHSRIRNLDQNELENYPPVKY